MVQRSSTPTAFISDDYPIASKSTSHEYRNFCLDCKTDILRRKGVRVVSITEQADDTPTGKLLEGIIESVDEFYSENLAQEVTRGMREAASRGFWIASRTPYGYNMDERQSTRKTTVLMGSGPRAG